MTTTPSDLEVPESLRAALAAEAATIPVAPAASDRIRHRGRRRKRRRRTLASAAVVLVLAASAGAVVRATASDDDGHEQLRTTEERFPALTGSGPQPLLVMGLQTGQDRVDAGLEPFDGLSQIDELSPTGERSPWWYRQEGSDWGVTNGVELVNGQRIGLAVGEAGSPLDGRYAVAEISDAGRTTAQHVLDLPALAADRIGGAYLIGATGNRLLLGWDVQDSAAANPIEDGVPMSPITTTVFSYDLRTNALEELRSGIDLGRMAVAGDVLVEISPDDGCTLLVHTGLGRGPTHEAPGACTGDGLATTGIEALSPDGRYAAVTRYIVTGGAPVQAVLLVDLEVNSGEAAGAAREVLRADAPVPIVATAWTGPRTASLAVVTDDPQFTDVLPFPPSATGNTPDDPTVVAVPFRERS